MPEELNSNNAIAQIDQQLRQLAKLKADGLITEEEFNAQKKSILGGARTQATRPTQFEIWNPAALANWSVLLTPLFGAFLQAKNWEYLGNQRESKKSMVWFYIGIAVMLSVFLDLAIALAAYIILLFAWYFVSNRKQQKYVRDNFGSAYPRKRWGLPLSLALVATVTWQIAVLRLNLKSHLPLLAALRSEPARSGQTAPDATSPLAKTPLCADEGVKDAAVKAAVERVTNGLPDAENKLLLSAIHGKIDLITTQGFDNITGTRHCSGLIGIEFSSDLRKTVELMADNPPDPFTNRPTFPEVVDSWNRKSRSIQINTSYDIAKAEGQSAGQYVISVSSPAFPTVQTALTSIAKAHLGLKLIAALEQEESQPAKAKPTEPTAISPESTAPPEARDVIKTKYGTVEITETSPDTQRLLIDGQRVKDAQGRPFESQLIKFEGNWELSKYHVIVLYQNCADSACGATNSYYFLALASSGKKALSAPFGDGREDATVKNDNGKIVADFGANGMAMLENGVVKITPSLLHK